MNSLILAAFLFTIAIQASTLKKSYDESKPRLSGATPKKPSFSPPTPIKEHQGYEGDEETEAVEPDYSSYNHRAISSSYFGGNRVDLTSAILEYNKNFNLPNVTEELLSSDRRVQRTSSGTFVYLPDHGTILFSTPSNASVEYVPVVPFYPGVPLEFSVQASKWITCLNFEDDVEILKRETLEILRRH